MGDSTPAAAPTLSSAVCPGTCSGSFNCYNAQTGSCSQAATQAQCEATAGCWTPGGPVPPAPTPGGTCPGKCSGSTNCYHSQWQPVPCSPAASQAACIASQGCWTPAPGPVPPTPGPVPPTPGTDCPGQCSGVNNCYHPQWPIPCSQAADRATCATSSGCWTSTPMSLALVESTPAAAPTLSSAVCPGTCSGSF